MKRIGISAPAGKENIRGYAVQAADMLRGVGAEVYCEDDLLSVLPGCLPFSRAERMDALLSLGGDGTILRCAQYAIRWNTPLLGINLGNTGFLAETEPDCLESAIQCLMSGRYTVEERAVLEVVGEQEGRWLAVNDVVVTRGGYARLIRVRVLVDGENAGEYRADGIVIATSTGSTGYSLSAGGPIISPKVDCMVITPVCAHSLQHRPEVVHSSAEIRIELFGDDKMEGELQVDGRSCLKLHAGQSLNIRRSSCNVRLVRLSSPKFFEIVHQKLIEWAR